MIDRAARIQLADAIRALAGGLITDDQFEARIPDSLDPAIHEIFANGAWFLYSDLYEHKLRGSRRLPDQDRPEIARWILFLKTERSYDWPVPNRISRLAQAILSLVTLGAAGQIFHHWFKRNGHFEVWPFIDRAHYQDALSARPYLRGAA